MLTKIGKLLLVYLYERMTGRLPADKTLTKVFLHHMSVSQNPSSAQSSSTTEIYVVGAASTGKTTLCQALFTRLGLEGPEFVVEVARDIMKSHGFTRDDVGSMAMQMAIMNEQFSRETKSREAAASSGRVLLSDRSAVDAVVYAAITSTNDEEAEQRFRSLTDSHRFQLALSAYRRALVILLAPVPEWLEDDLIRMIDKQVRTGSSHNLAF